ncbi:hypothetical protein AURDEDRAFT_183953 [Auricularia subglabra TFB-10046 SS5]|nr:hypothetical protein AURDEDRAFT_183953 [Auricularia subglabra TFB-10046 SS5]
MDITLLLPTELMWAILNHSTLPDVVRASLVCQRWRSIAFEHKQYWSQIVLHDTHASALRRTEAELAIARLSRSSAAPVDADVVLYNSQDWIDDLLACIRENLHRFRDLRVRLPKQYHQQLRSLVSTTAPLLEHLELAAPRVTWELLRSLTPNFASLVPQLRALRLSRFTIDDADREQFDTVQELSLRGSTSLDAGLLASRFPNARHFTHRGRMLEFPSKEALSSSVTAWLRGLQYLSLHHISLESIADWSAIKHIPTIRVDNPTVETTDTLLCHFGKGEILVDLERYVFPRQPLTVRQLSTGLTRILDFVDWVWLPDVPQFSVLAPQVAEVSLPAGSWEEAFVAIGDPPLLRHITVQLDETFEDTVIKFGDRIPPVYAPALRTFTITGDAGIDRVDGDGLLSFTDELLVLRGERAPVVLELRGVEWGEFPLQLKNVFVISEP